MNLLDYRSRAGLLGGLLGTALAFPALAQNATVTTQEALENPDPTNWMMVHGNYAAHRYSELDSINLDNIDQLELAYTFAIMGVEGGGSRYANASLEGTPIVEDGIMYFPNGWGVVYAIDVTSGDYANVLWRTDPGVDKPWAGDVACCGINNRGVAFWQDKIIQVALDGRVIALDKATGSVVWERNAADPAIAETLTVGPLVIRDMAIVGPAGAEYGIRGWLDATDLNTGEQVWRTYTVAGPDEPGGETWIAPGTYENGGGSIWVTGTYDPGLNLTYWGTGNPGPDWDAEYRPGDNLYTDSALALNADTGEIVWYFQYTPNDPYDYDEISEHHLVHVEVDGVMRHLALHAGRNGYFYGLDAATGEFVYGKQYTTDMSWTPGLDPKTGLPLAYDPATAVQAYVEGATPQRGNQGGTVCPIHTGGKNWEPAAYNPTLQLLYVAGGEGCNQRVTAVQEAPEWQGGTWKYRDRFVGGGGPAAPFEPANPEWVVRDEGALTSIDVTTGEVNQKLHLDYFNRAGVLATAGGWVMIGEYDGWIRAFDAADLENEVWRFNVGSAIKAPPISYEADGVQYVAILVGAVGGSAQFQANPMLNMFAPAHSLYVFRLDQDA